jgi:hypothetical protein
MHEESAPQAEQPAPADRLRLVDLIDQYVEANGIKVREIAELSGRETMILGQVVQHFENVRLGSMVCILRRAAVITDGLTGWNDPKPNQESAS